MPQRPLITFEYVVENFNVDQDGLLNDGPATVLSNSTAELNNNNVSEQNGLHQIKIFRSNSNVAERRQNYLANSQMPFNGTPTNSVSTTEIWHHGPR